MNKKLFAFLSLSFLLVSCGNEMNNLIDFTNHINSLRDASKNKWESNFSSNRLYKYTLSSFYEENSSYERENISFYGKTKTLKNNIFLEDFASLDFRAAQFSYVLEKGNLDDGTKYLFKFNALMPENYLRQIYFKISYFNLEEEQNLHGSFYMNFDNDYNKINFSYRKHLTDLTYLQNNYYDFSKDENFNVNTGIKSRDIDEIGSTINPLETFLYISRTADNEDGFINGSLVKEKVVYFDELNNETLGWFNVGDIQSVSRAVNLMNQNCKFNFFDKFEAVTKTSYSLELDDTYYKFFDADLFTYTREITIGHHSNLVDFIQVFN